MHCASSSTEEDGNTVTPETRPKSPSRDPETQSTSSHDSGNVSATSSTSTTTACFEYSEWTETQCCSAEDADIATTSVEKEPLIEKEHNEARECGKVRDAWKQTNLLSAHLMTSKVSLVSTASSVLCRICHTEGSLSRDPLVSPCRCSGSLLYIHRSCLVHWLELSTRKMMPSPRCELCGYNYKRSNFLNLRSVHFPRLEYRDRLLNLLFVVASTIMILCAGLSIHFLQLSEQYHATVRGYRVVSSSLTNDDVTVVICSVLFFAAFFTAVFTQYRAEASIFRLLFRFWVINRNWTIRNYDIREDPEMLAVREARLLRVDVPRFTPKQETKPQILSPNQLPITVFEAA